MSNTQTKKLISADGTIVYYLDGKMHNLEGPAYIPEGDMKKKEYYINGIKYSEPEWKAAKKGGDGLPWYKSGGAKARF
jgi:antitoxin component YwqK of YwqJK toxin-antitoxin module